jgi:hypothetical protein
VSHNYFHIGVLVNNKINVNLAPIAASYVNQNTFMVGQYNHGGEEGINVAGVCHVKMRAAVGANNGAPNSNSFIVASVEGDTAEFAFDIQGLFNRFTTPRTEFSAGYGTQPKINFHSVVNGDSGRNVIDAPYAYGHPIISYTGATIPRGNIITNSNYNNSMETQGSGLNIVNNVGDGASAPHIRGFSAAQLVITKTPTDTDWVYNISAGGVALKLAADPFAKIDLTTTGIIKLGSGAATPPNTIASDGTAIRIAGNILPTVNNTYNLGGGGVNFSYVAVHVGVYVQNIQVVGPQKAAVTDPTGGAVVDVECRAQLASLLNRVRAHGLIA